MPDIDMAEIDIHNMITGGQVISATAQTVSGQQQQTEAMMEQLMKTWTGDSATAFRNSMGTFYDQCQQVASILQTVSEQITNGAQTYAKQHQMNIDVAGSMGAGLENFSAS